MTSGGERDPAEIDRQTAEHLRLCGEAELIVRHLYATLHRREWDGEDRVWLAAYLAAEHGLDFPEAMRLSEPGARVELARLIREPTADTKADPPAESRAARRAARNAMIAKRWGEGVPTKEIVAEVNRDYSDVPIKGESGIRAALKGKAPPRYQTRKRKPT